MRNDTRNYFNMRSKADIGWLSLPHGTSNKKVGKKEKEKRKTICSEVSVNSPGIRGVSHEEERECCDGKDLQKNKV